MIAVLTWTGEGAAVEHLPAMDSQDGAALHYTDSDTGATKGGYALIDGVDGARVWVDTSEATLAALVAAGFE